MGGTASELTQSRRVEREPAWSPDGKRIAFAADRGDGFDLYVVSARGGTPERVAVLDGDERWPSWTPDGRIVFANRASDTDAVGSLRRSIPTCAIDKRDPAAAHAVAG